MGSELFIKLERFLIIIKLESIKLERLDCTLKFEVQLQQIKIYQQQTDTVRLALVSVESTQVTTCHEWDI